MEQALSQYPRRRAGNGHPDFPTLFQLTCLLGFTLWLSLALIDNLHGFASSRAAIGDGRF